MVSNNYARVLITDHAESWSYRYQLSIQSERRGFYIRMSLHSLEEEEENSYTTHSLA